MAPSKEYELGGASSNSSHVLKEAGLGGRYFGKATLVVWKESWSGANTGPGVVRAVTGTEIVRRQAGQVGVHAVNATAVPGADSLMRLNVRKELGMTQAAAEGRWWHQ